MNIFHCWYSQKAVDKALATVNIMNNMINRVIEYTHCVQVEYNVPPKCPTKFGDEIYKGLGKPISINSSNKEQQIDKVSLSNTKKPKSLVYPQPAIRLE